MNALRQQVLLVLASMMVGIVSAGCAASPAVSSSNPGHVSHIDSVLLMPPILECVDSESGQPKSLDDAVAARMETSIVAEMASGLGGKNIDSYTPSDFPTLAGQDRQEHEALYLAIKLGSSPMDASHRECLEAIAAVSNASHILFSRCRCYAGRGGSWNPWDGAMTSGTSRMVLDSHLFCIQENRVVWTRASQVRASPGKAGERIPEMVAGLLETLNVN